MTETALFKAICELTVENVELKQRQTYLLLTVNRLHERLLALEQTTLQLTKARLEAIVKAED